MLSRSRLCWVIGSVLLGIAAAPACGGKSSSESGGTGATPSGGTSSAGTSSGGTSSGGTSSGGTSSGGTSSGGTSSGGNAGAAGQTWGCYVSTEGGGGGVGCSCTKGGTGQGDCVAQGMDFGKAGCFLSDCGSTQCCICGFECAFKDCGVAVAKCPPD